ncbi:MAG: tail fiber domain-containing protein [Candidatus Bathyarchaeota archaeon]|nr:tail fiber domain-containing protein [Candidatus Bathyarchaeota archaeon]
MTVLFSDDFESNDFGAWSGHGANVSTVSSPVKQGAYGMRANSNAYGSTLKTGLNRLGNTFALCYLYMENLPTSGNYITFLRLSASGFNDGVAARIYNDGSNYRWVLCTPSGNQVSDPVSLSAETWYRVEIQRQVGSGNDGVASLWVDGTLIYSSTTETMTSATDIIDVGIINGENNPICIDSLVVSSDRQQDVEGTQVIGGDQVVEGNMTVNGNITGKGMLDISRRSLFRYDVGCFGFFGSMTDPAKGTGGGAVQIGHGFTSPSDHPQLNLTDTISGGSGAHAYINVVDGVIQDPVPVDNQGSGYHFADVDIQKPTNGAGARLYPVINGPITNILILDPGSGYSQGDPITISAPTQGTNLASAEVSSVDNYGKITGISITQQGDYYDSIFTGAEIRIEDSSGRGAQFQVVVNGKIREIHVVEGFGGKGYTPSDVVTITNNPHSTLYLQQSIWGSASPAHLDLGNLNVHGASGYSGIFLDINENHPVIQWGNTSEVALRLAQAQNSVGEYLPALASQYYNEATEHWVLGDLYTSQLHTDHLISSQGEGIYLFDSLRLYGGAPQAVGQKLYDSTNDSGSAGEVLTIDSSTLLPQWKAPAWNGGTVTGDITVSKSGAALNLDSPSLARLRFVAHPEGTNYIESAINGSTGSSAPLLFTNMYAQQTWMVITTAGQVQIPTLGSNAGLLVGTDCQWYRNAANVWRTPDSVTIDSDLTLGGGLYGYGGALNIATDTNVVHANNVFFNVKSTTGSPVINLAYGDPTPSTRGTFGYDHTNSLTYLTSNVNLKIAVAAGYHIDFNNTPFTNYLSSLGSGTPSSSTFLRGDGTWSVPTWNGGTVTNNITMSKYSPMLLLMNTTATTSQLRFIPFPDGTNYIESGLESTTGSAAPIKFTNIDATSTWMVITTTGQLQLPKTGSDAGILAGTDVQWYRNAANEWRTPDAVTIDGNLKTGGSLSGSSGTLNVSSDTNISHSGAAYLNLNSTNNSAAINVAYGGNTKGAFAYDPASDYTYITAAGGTTNLKLASAGGYIYTDNVFHVKGSGQDFAKWIELDSPTSLTSPPGGWTAGSVRVVCSAAGVLQVQNSAGGLATLDASTVFTDHLNSASGDGIYIIDTLKPYGSSINISGRVDSDSVIHGGGSNGDAFQVGDDIYIVDINNANRLSLQGAGDRSQAGIQFGSGGPYIYKDGSYMRVGSNWVVDGLIVASSWANTTQYGPLYRNSNGQIGYNTSSIRFKDNICNVTDCSWVYNLRPVSFDWKDQERAKTEGTQLGLIAEEVNQQCPQLVFKDKEGTPEGVHYEWLGVPLLVEIKKLRSRVEALENQLKLTQTAA